MMKVTSLLCLLTLGMSATAGEEAFHHNLPDSGLLPSCASVSGITRMGERHGGSDMCMQTYKLNIPLSDPRKSGWDNWMLNVELSNKVTHFNTGGELHLKHDEVYSVAVPVSILRKETSGNALILGMSPAIATDSGAADHGIDCALYGMYHVKHSETFSYTFGLLTAPRFVEHMLLPVVAFEWTPCDDWVIRMKGDRAEALYKLNDNFYIGPFMAEHGGIWSVETDAGDRQFRVRSLVLGITGEYNFAAEGEAKRIITFSVGSTVATSAEFTERGVGKHAYETHHYKPGIFISAGVDFRF
jgi:hypothetical protein